MKTKRAGTALTVIIRDDVPLVFAGGSPAYRRVTINLTPEQIAGLNLWQTGSQGGSPIFESVSLCFLEDTP